MKLPTANSTSFNGNKYKIGKLIMKFYKLKFIKGCSQNTILQTNRKPYESQTNKQSRLIEWGFHMKQKSISLHWILVELLAIDSCLRL